MIFRQLFDHESATYTYIIADKDSKDAVIIDPVIDQSERDIALIKELGLKLLWILETHLHADHITGAQRLRDAFGAKTGIGRGAGVACADRMLDQGDRIEFGRHEIRVAETPGHTGSCLSFIMLDRVFTGDALFVRGCGRTDFQSGSAEALYQSVTEKLFHLPDATLVYPAHDYKGHTVTTIGEEKKFNPRLSHGRDSFLTMMASLKLADPKKIHEAIPANLKCGKTH